MLQVFGLNGITASQVAKSAKPEEFTKYLKILFYSLGCEERARKGPGLREGFIIVVVIHDYCSWPKNLHNFTRILFQE